MPDDSSGNYSVPAGTIVNTGDTILPSQHNPWATDSSNAISNRFSKDGRAPATGNWNLNNFRITGLGAPVASNDAVNKTYADGIISVFSVELYRGQINGLQLTNNGTDSANDVDIAAGSAGSDGATPVLITLSAAMTKRFDAAWAVGSGNGGLDTGVIGNGKYYIYLIQRSDTGVVDVLCSLSSTSPTLPSSYDRKAVIGAFTRSAGVNGIPYWLDGRPQSAGFNPVLTPGTGTLTSATSSMSYTKIGNRVLFSITIVITTNGTGAVSLNFTLPFVPAVSSAAYGRETAVNGKGVLGSILAGVASCGFTNYDNTYPGVNNGTYILAGSYQV